ncbi:MAG: V-type ATP synthase subunit E family protein [Candidatus Thermoplasmatota archaeon]|nr:V-type ATP synthase subunit E family protein [Candidatus Thermoplasmatota archaeon]
MSAEKIINQIKKDAQNEIKQIQTEAEKQAKNIMIEAEKQAKLEAEKILTDGKRQCENIKKILLSKASQEAKRDTMKTKEKIIEECFLEARHKLSTLEENKYKRIVTRIMKDGKQKLGGDCTVIVSRGIDKKIAQELELSLSGTVETSGGIKLKSTDGRITLDHTFDGILGREKDEIRIKVGKLLFS